MKQILIILFAFTFLVACEKEDKPADGKDAKKTQTDPKLYGNWYADSTINPNGDLITFDKGDCEFGKYIKKYVIDDELIIWEACMSGGGTIFSYDYTTENRYIYRSMDDEPTDTIRYRLEGNNRMIWTHTNGSVDYLSKE